ncbi:SGNH/GDSL hydrolase family protein [Niabella beijingensis]|uniref:SGNH/GDSL hydrolase family protein n=1 Tax=Niabella beijingensis TaxID=2872700 RepID=UPI001CBBA8FC|nr:SGNH/GDSL hydrolase family protein [Niabella beijingensis]MBZ4191232.1 SGNH/GDSL hydrolase family protein [Niabella beijingensis]
MKRVLVALLLLPLLFSYNKKKLTWVAIGDSITYLNDHLPETGNRVTKGYLTQVTELLPDVQYVNKGYNGWTAAQIAGAFDSLHIPPADVYTVFLGTNDWWQGRPVGTLADYKKNTGNRTVFGSFRIIIDKLRKTSNHARILLITPLRRTDFVYIGNMHNNAWGSYREKNDQSLAQVAAAVATIGHTAKLDVVDLYNDPELGQKELVHFKRLRNPATGRYQNYTYPYFHGIPFNPETDDYPYPPEAADLTYDGLHPSDKGNRIIAGRLVPLLKKR